MKFEDDYCQCGDILQHYEKDVCDNCYDKHDPKKKHDEDLKDLASIVKGDKKQWPKT